MDTKKKFIKNELILGDRVEGIRAKNILNILVDDLMNMEYEDLTHVEKWVIEKTCVAIPNSDKQE